MNIRYLLCILFLSIFFSLPVFTEITFTIEYPETNLVDSSLFEGIFDAFLNDYFRDIEETVKKDDMMQAFSEANAFGVSIITNPASYSFHTLIFSISVAVSSQLFTTHYDKFTSIISESTYEDDLYLGFGVHPFTCSFLLYPEHFFPRIADYLAGLILGIHLGGFSIHYYEYEAHSFNIGISGLYSFFSKQHLNNALSWEPLKINTGLSYFHNSIIIPFSTEILIPLIIDPDGAIGPIGTLTGDAVISMTPEIGFHSKTVILPVTFITSFNFGVFFLMDLGIGLDMFWGRAYMEVDDDTPISTQGDIASLFDSTGRLILEGKLFENYPHLFRIKLSLGLGFNFDPVWIKIPIIYHIRNGISTGIKIGFSY